MNIRLNTPDVIHESFDNETVIVNLRVGVYFSLNETGLPLWEEIGRGTTEEHLVATWQTKQGADEAGANAAVRAFLKELQEEQLIVTDPAEIPAAPAGPLPAAASRPALQKYTDLQDLLMLDPIHDVDERGWPHSKPAAGDAATGA